MPAAYNPSSNVAELRESATIAVSDRARALRAAGRPIIDLGAGEPDFATPSFVRDAAVRALHDGATRYTQVEGILPLREAIAALANERYGGTHPVEPTDVIVTTGSKQALFNACFTLFGAGDEVLVPTPAWTSYYEMLALARATPVIVRGARERSLKVTPDDLEAAATPRTRGIMLNSPCNPTGAVYSATELRAIVECCVAHGWWIVADEIYRRIAYDAPAASLLDVASVRDRLVIVDGVAKAYAMTGWRIGWAVAPRAVARAMTAFQSHTTSNATTLSQHAALEALTNRQAADAAVATMVAAFRERRDAALALLRDADVDVIEPRGAFYLYLHAGRATPEDPAPGATLATRLLEEHDVAIVPGTAFHSPEWVRLSYATRTETVLEGVRRLCAVHGGRAAHRPIPCT